MKAMWRSVPPLALGLFLSGNAAAAPAPCPAPPEVNDRCPTWDAVYNHPGGLAGQGPDIMRDAALSADGSRIYVAGTSYDNTTGYDAAISAHATADGATAWTKRWSTHEFDTYSSVAVSPDGSLVAVTGRSGPQGALDALTTVYRAGDGTELWSHLYDGPDRSDDYVWTMTFSADGSRLFVGGSRDDGAGEAHGDAILLAYDPLTGDLLSEFSFAAYPNEYDVFYDLALSPDGSRVYAAGQSYAPGSSGDAVVVAFDISGSGIRQLWAARYDGASNLDRGVDVAVNPDGSRIAVSAESRAAGASTNDWSTVLLDAGGNRLWAARYSGGNNGEDAPAGVVFAGDKVITAGSSAEFGTNRDYAARAYSISDGSVLWTSLYRSPANYTDVPRSLAVSPDGSTVYVTGYSFYPRGTLGPVFQIGNGAYLTVAFETSDGDRKWIGRYSPSGRGEDVAQAVLPSPDGKTVYVAGTFVYNGTFLFLVPQTGPSSFDFGTVAYSA